MLLKNLAICTNAHKLKNLFDITLLCVLLCYNLFTHSKIMVYVKKKKKFVKPVPTLVIFSGDEMS